MKCRKLGQVTDWHPFGLKTDCWCSCTHQEPPHLGNAALRVPLGKKNQVVSRRKLSFREMWSPPVFHQAPQQNLAKAAEWPVFASSAHSSTSLLPEMRIWWGRTGKEKPVLKELMRKPPYWFWHTHCSNYQKRVRTLFHPHGHSYLVNWQGFRALPVFPQMQKKSPSPPQKSSVAHYSHPQRNHNKRHRVYHLQAGNSCLSNAC